MSQKPSEQAPQFSARVSSAFKLICGDYVFVRLFAFAALLGSVLSFAQSIKMDDSNPLAMPPVGGYQLRVLTPTLLELTLINTKDRAPAPFPSWNFVNNNTLALPAATEFAVTVNGQAASVKSLGFKRRPLYAPLKVRDLRVANHLYVELNSSIPDGAAVEVKNPSGNVWGGTAQYTAAADPLRFNPAIHVNEVGYAPNWPKKAMVGYYLGSLGELTTPATTFSLVRASDGVQVFSGPLTSRLDVGYTYNPKPYQKVLQADFSAFTTSGEYRLKVPGMGASFAFLIDEGVPAQFARAYALGLYHQRCGGKLEFPFTRHTHENCHHAPAEILTMANTTQQGFIAGVSADFANEPRHTAPQLKDVNSSLYPFVNSGTVNVTLGHHDAGDYSKYTINSAGLVHSLVFAADSFAGVAALDNLGLPESGDGKSDILQEAKWEADFLAKMQDADGGFYFLVYPKNRKYEDDVTPDKGDAQVVWPKTTAVTAAAVAALAEAGSSPTFKRQFPVEAAAYLAKAQLGWAFLEAAIAKHGKDGSYQKLTHYGHEFMHDDELAWAAAAMYAATGNPLYHLKLKEWFPNPNDPNTRRWSWWKLFEGYGNAVRTYAFAARSGRLLPAQLDAAYLLKCETEIIGAAEDHVRFSQQTAYGTSFPDLNKAYRTAGWYFSSERAFDVTVAYQLTPRADFKETVVANASYEAGNNPLNMSFVTGLGWKRQRDIVHQQAQTDRQILPPTGIPLGNIQAGFTYTYHYGTELSSMTFPPDGTIYPYYDRWADTFNTTTEFVIMDSARSLANLAFWMAESPVKTQAWRAATATITGLPTQIAAEKTVTAMLSVPGLDTSKAQVVWEARDQEPFVGQAFTFSPKFPGDQWVEVEATLPDGRRVFAKTNFIATTSESIPPNKYKSAISPITADMVAAYRFDADLSDATGLAPAMTTIGAATRDISNLGWMTNRTGGALRVLAVDDAATVTLPASSFTGSSAMTIEAMIYINEYKAWNVAAVPLISLSAGWTSQLELREDMYAGSFVRGGSVFSVAGTTLNNALTTKTWHHISISVEPAGYILKINGQVIATAPSNELSNWGSNPAVLELGNFDGWVDEVIVRNNRTAPANKAPTVALTSPTAGATFSAGTIINLAANAADADGSVAKVEFYRGSTKVGEDTAAPYELAQSALAAGTHTFTARAVDEDGAVGASTAVSVTVLAGNMVSPPTFSQPGGSFSTSVTVALSTATTGATIRYTLDGTTPTETSAAYSAALTLTQTTTVKAQAFKSGMTASSVATATFVKGVAGSATATFVRADTTTLGAWPFVYGADGFRVLGDTGQNPSYVQPTLAGGSEYTWSDGTTDPRALLRANETEGVVRTYYSPTSFTVSLPLTDSTKRRVSFYCLDWDRQNRIQTVEAVDAASGAVLATQTVSNFENGKYLVWDVSGNVTFRFTKVSGPNALLMGWFFDAAPRQAKVKPRGFVNGLFQLEVTGITGQTYTIQASTDLKTWTTVTSVIAGESASIVTDPGAGQGKSRFYRLVQ
ncbi:MAG TPA: glycoside hydrolase family 9 protein [Methylomirabilota bacterium]|nr:glycoside hydrolase family 9 protein [Methylomirabilota bacterium]